MRERNKAVLPVGRICGSSCESSEEWLGGGRAVKEVVVVEGEDARPDGDARPKRVNLARKRGDLWSMYHGGKELHRMQD